MAAPAPPPSARGLRSTADRALRETSDDVERAMEWIARYRSEKGHLPDNAEQLRAFALHRGARFPYTLAQRALVEVRLLPRQWAPLFPAAPMAAPPPQPASGREGRSQGGEPRSVTAVRGGHLREGPNAAAAARHQPADPDRTSTGMPRAERAETPQLDSRAAAAEERGRAEDGTQLMDLLESRATVWEALEYLQRWEQHVFSQAQEGMRLTIHRVPRPVGNQLCSSWGQALLQSFPQARLEPGTICAICIEETDGSCTEPWLELPCGHRFHRACLAELVCLPHRRNCPLCRYPLWNRTTASAGETPAPGPQTVTDQAAAQELSQDQLSATREFLVHAHEQLAAQHELVESMEAMDGVSGAVVWRWFNVPGQTAQQATAVGGNGIPLGIRL